MAKPLTRSVPQSGARLHFTKDGKIRDFSTVNCTALSKAEIYLAKRGIAPFEIPII